MSIGRGGRNAYPYNGQKRHHGGQSSGFKALSSLTLIQFKALIITP